MIAATAVSRQLRRNGITVQSSPNRPGVRVKHYDAGHVRVVCDFDRPSDIIAHLDACEAALTDLGYTVVKRSEMALLVRY